MFNETINNIYMSAFICFNFVYIYMLYIIHILYMNVSLLVLQKFVTRLVQRRGGRLLTPAVSPPLLQPKEY